MIKVLNEFFRTITTMFCILCVAGTILFCIGIDISYNEAPVITSISGYSVAPVVEEAVLKPLCRELLIDGSLSLEVYDCDTFEVVLFD